MKKISIIISVIAMVILAVLPSQGTWGKDKKKTATAQVNAAKKDSTVAKPSKAAKATKSSKKKKTDEPTVTQQTAEEKNCGIAGRALAILINEKSTVADTIAKQISRNNRKSPAMQTEIARAYFRNNDRENTRLYLDKAMKIDKNYAPAYNLKGRSYGTYDKDKKMYVLIPSEADSACYWFDKSIEADRLNPQPYLDYADAMSWKNMPAAIAKLEELRKNIPSYNVDLAIAELYETKVKRSKTAEEAAAARLAADSVVTNLDPRKLTSNQLAKFAMAAFWASNTKRAEELALIGTEKFPANKDYNRVVGWAAARNGNYQRALEYLDKYYARVPKDSVDKIDLRSMDYLSYGMADLNLESYSLAETDFRNALGTNDDYTSQMPMQINSVYNGKFRKLIADKRYEDAYKLYPRYINTLSFKEQEDKWVYMFDQFLYNMDEADEDGKKQLLSYMDEIAQTLGDHYPHNEDLPKIYYYVMVYTQQIYDPESTEGTAVTAAGKLLSCISGQSPDDMKSNVRTYASTACDIIAFFEFKGKNDTPTATKYWQKALYYNPEDSQAYNILSQLHALPKAGASSESKTTKKSKRKR